MNSYQTRQLPAWFPPVLVAMFGVLGLIEILRGTRQYELWTVVTGVAYLILALSQFSALRDSNKQDNGKTVAHRVSLAAAVLGLVLMLAATLVPASGIDPVAWFVGRASVSPASLVHHPLLYNHQYVHTAGRVSANDQGWCMLEVGNPASQASPNRHSPATTIVLAARGLTCAKPGTAPTWAKVSGVFQVLQTSRDFRFPYVLRNARMTRKKVSGQPGSR